VTVYVVEGSRLFTVYRVISLSFNAVTLYLFPSIEMIKYFTQPPPLVIENVIESLFMSVVTDNGGLASTTQKIIVK
jgi:hypothetical protein